MATCMLEDGCPAFPWMQNHNCYILIVNFKVSLCEDWEGGGITSACLLRGCCASDAPLTQYSGSLSRQKTCVRSEAS